MQTKALAPSHPTSHLVKLSLPVFYFKWGLGDQSVKVLMYVTKARIFSKVLTNVFPWEMDMYNTGRVQFNDVFFRSGNFPISKNNR